MWVYKQSTGEFFKDGARLGIGYSGAPGHKNKPDDEHLSNRGPIPRGRYRIGPVVAIEGKGPVCIDLAPTAEQRANMHGRGGFLIHGDSISAPGTASRGCIILRRSIREAVVASPDKDLEVVR